LFALTAFSKIADKSVHLLLLTSVTISKRKQMTGMQCHAPPAQ